MGGLTLCIGLVVCAVLAGCEKPVNPNDLQVSYRADPKSIKEDRFGYADGCPRAGAQAPFDVSPIGCQNPK